MRPKAILLDYGGTLVEEVGYDLRAGNEMMLARAAYRPAHVTIEHVVARAERITKEVAERREESHIETPWPALTRLIYDALGIRFDQPMAELELAFWKTITKTEPMPGVREALDEIQRLGVPTAVVSNCSFGPEVLRHELVKHGLGGHLSFVMVSAEYAVRKPEVLLFETAAARLGVAPQDIWFVGDRLDTDVAGANAAGMKSVWLRPSVAEVSAAPFLTVSNWAEMVEQLRRA